MIAFHLDFTVFIIGQRREMVITGSGKTKE